MHHVTLGQTVTKEKCYWAKGRLMEYGLSNLKGFGLEKMFKFIVFGNGLISTEKSANNWNFCLHKKWGLKKQRIKDKIVPKT